MANRRGKGGRSDRFPLLGLQNHCGWWLQPWSQKIIAPWQESNDKPRQCVEKQSHYSADKDPYSQGYGFPVVTYGCEIWTIKKQNAKELMPSKSGALEDSWNSPGQGDQTHQILGKSTLNTGWKDWCWNWSSSIWCEQWTHWKSPWCWEKLRPEG